MARMPSADAERCNARLQFLLPLLRWALGYLWIYTGIISAFVYPQADSYVLLREVGIGGWMLPVALYGAAALDGVLGLAVLLRWRPHLIGMAQIAVILVYTSLISLFLPAYWLHPFGPLSKNIPLLVGIMINAVGEQQ